MCIGFGKELIIERFWKLNVLWFLSGLFLYFCLIGWFVLNLLNI